MITNEIVHRGAAIVAYARFVETTDDRFNGLVLTGMQQLAKCADYIITIVRLGCTLHQERLDAHEIARCH